MLSSAYACLVALLLVTQVSSGTATATAADSGEWLQYADVRQAGFDGAALRAVCERADRLKSGAVMAVFRGRVILACGDVTRKFEAHSVRKSLLSVLYGTAVARGQIDLDSTLANFSIDERTPLSVKERSATIRQVISARSGVYLPAAYGASQARGRPARASHAPGTHWFYNNWDFNVAGVVYERATREDLYASYTGRLAEPLGMEDWDPADGFRVYEPTKSLHPAHTFRISTRDLARVGQLYLQEGRWLGRQIVPADWVKESTRPHTDDGDGTGYGYMWWIYQAGSSFTAKYPNLGKHAFYRALGSGEQGLWVIDGAELVVVHRADTDHGLTVDGEEHWQLVESILAARIAPPTPTSTPDLRPLKSTILSSQRPAAPIPEYRSLSADALKQYLGDYELRGATTLGSYKLNSDSPVRVFSFDDKPFVHLPGVGDVQIFLTDRRDRFIVRVVPDVHIAFERGTEGDVTTIVLTHADATIRAFKASQTR